VFSICCNAHRPAVLHPMAAIEPPCRSRGQPALGSPYLWHAPHRNRPARSRSRCSNHGRNSCCPTHAAGRTFDPPTRPPVTPPRHSSPPIGAPPTKDGFIFAVLP